MGNTVSGGIVSYMGGLLLQQSYGVAVGKGNKNNVLVNITGGGNVIDDGLDENPSCGTNRWIGDDLTTTNPANFVYFYPGCGL
jgi:hypothetical protein